jgi:hypothetical protein
MHADGALAIMPPKKRKAAVGRPKSPEPMHSILSLKGTPEMEAWLDELVEATDLGTRTLLLRHALKMYAESRGFRPIPKR